MTKLITTRVIHSILRIHYQLLLHVVINLLRASDAYIYHIYIDSIYIHIYVGNLTIIGSENGLAPTKRQAIIWSNAGILLFGPTETNLSELFNRNPYIFIKENVFEKVGCKMATILS